VTRLSDGESPFEPTLFLYETVPGGTGFAPLLFDRHEALVRGALDIVKRCACETGCPACVGPAGPSGTGVRSHALQVLALLARAAPPR
jgi:DEAD/DEAH box helicase domain-containing protein